MRRRTHHKKHRRRHSRRVGALNLKSKDTGLKLLAVAGGFFMGDAINGGIDSLVTKVTGGTATTTTTPATTSTSPVTAIAEIGIGGLLLMRKKSGGMNTVLKLGGGVLAGAGIKRLMKQMGVIKGYQSVPVIGRHRMTGYQSVPVIGGIPPQLAGKMPAQLQGYRVNGYTAAGSGVMGAIDSGSGSGITTHSGSGYMG